MAGKPLWRRTFDAVERPVGSRLETAVQTDLFADLAGLLLRARAGAERRIEQTTRHALHRVNLPAASDVARLREQISDLNRTVRRLEDALREERDGQTRGGADGADDGAGRSGVQGAPRRRAQPAAGTQRRQVRSGG